MPLPSSLLILARFMAGEFNNREQAIADPVWYVHLRMWQRPVAMFVEDSITLFAEQANVLYPENPYRQRLMRLMAAPAGEGLQVQYYSFKVASQVSGGGQNPQLLAGITEQSIDLLPGCVLKIAQPQPSVFVATAASQTPCYFEYQGETRQVSLGFEAREQEFMSYDKGIDLETGQAIWGAVMGPYRFTKQQNYSIDA